MEDGVSTRAPDLTDANAETAFLAPTAKMLQMLVTLILASTELLASTTEPRSVAPVPKGSRASSVSTMSMIARASPAGMAAHVMI